ncbi:hypothetical protein M0R45_015916 [Rubus argutus]|uniref:Uncharacterized protein n=1 Tax=Rubus argutus TaxID=59490 RepID=A0AAW1XTJ9_RUBAR
MTTSAAARVAAMMAMVMVMIVKAANTNNVYQPCADTRIERWDGFTFGIAFSSRDSFFYNQNQSHQLSPCDRRLSLASSNSQLALFRPKVHEISLLTINTSTFQPISGNAKIGITVEVDVLCPPLDIVQ